MSSVSRDATSGAGASAGSDNGKRGGIKTVQEYIDETPIWSDGTAVSSTPMTAMQWRIWILASAGKFFEGLVVFMTGVALPLIVKEFDLGAMEKGAVGAAPLFGILIGATALGGLSDRVGRKRMFIVEMILFAVSLLLLVVSPGYPWLLVFLCIMGTAVGYLILYENPDVGAWRWMYATGIVPAVLVVFARCFIPDSRHWLVSRGRIDEAERETERLLARSPAYPQRIKLAVSLSTTICWRRKGRRLSTFSCLSELCARF